MNHIPWEIRFLFTPWRWFGEEGLIHIYTHTREEARRWIVEQGLVGCLMELGATFAPVPNSRYVSLRIGSYQWNWAKAPEDHWRFERFRNWGRDPN